MLAVTRRLLPPGAQAVARDPRRTASRYQQRVVQLAIRAAARRSNPAWAGHQVGGAPLKDARAQRPQRTVAAIVAQLGVDGREVNAMSTISTDTGWRRRWFR